MASKQTTSLTLVVPTTTGTSRTRSISENGDSNPSLKELLKELETVVSKWQQLMLELRVDQHIIEMAEKNHKDDIYEQKFDVFNHWLRNDPDVSWSRVIKALRVIGQECLASQLEKKYAWKDPREKSTIHYLSVSQKTIIPVKANISKLPGLPAMPQKFKHLEYFTLSLEECLPCFLNNYDSSFKTYAHNIALHPLRKKLTDMAKIMKMIEESPYKDNFKVGIEARFGTMCYRLHPLYEDRHLQKQDCLKYEFRNTCFNTSVRREDAQRLVRYKERLGNDYTQLTLKFEVKGLGAYSAVIVIEGGKRFHLTAVYEEDTQDILGRYNITIPGREYDFRVADCSGYLIPGPKTSTPYQIAIKIVESMRSLPCGGGLEMLMKGSYGKYDWWVKYFRQRSQKQYDWRPDKKWILAVYEVSAYQQGETNPVNVTTASSDQLLETTFDYKRVEVELWGKRFYPKHVNDTYPTRDDYYHMEGVAGVRFLNGDTRPPRNWTTEELMIDFEEFIKEALLIAHLLDDSVTLSSESI